MISIIYLLVCIASLDSAFASENESLHSQSSFNTGTHAYPSNHHTINSSQSEKIAVYFRDNFDRERSNCPKDLWIDALYMMDPSPDKIYVDIGYNKGYNFAKFIGKWSLNLDITMADWYRQLQVHMPHIPPHDLKGNCNDYEEVLDVQHKRIVQETFLNQASGRQHSKFKNDKMIVLGYDLNPSMEVLSKKIATDLNVTIDNGIYFDLYTSAVSNSTGIISVHDCTNTTYEGCAIKPTNGRRSLLDIKSVTIDSIVDHMYKDIIPKFRAHAISNRIDFLKIDAEGFDGLILQGGVNSFRKSKVRVITFEYHSNNPWSSMLLRSTVSDLFNYGYVCFYEGAGRVWKLSGDYWHNYYEIHRWSNVICVHKRDKWRRIIERFMVVDISETNEPMILSSKL